MREIKFRAWDFEDKTMISGDTYEGSSWIADALEVLMHGGCDEWTERIGIMQFTGLLDRNGKEIWEGDILYQEILSPDDPALAGRYGNDSPVEFFRGVYRVCFNEKWYILSADVAAGTLEVIGNIYETVTH